MDPKHILSERHNKFLEYKMQSNSSVGKYLRAQL